MRKVTATVLLVGMLLPAACSKENQKNQSTRDSGQATAADQANQTPAPNGQPDATATERWNQPQTTVNQINPNGQPNPNATPAIAGTTTQPQAALTNPATPAAPANPAVATAAAVATYKVQPGDSLWKIAEKLSGKGYNCDLLKKFNNLPNDNIRVSQMLNVPPQWRTTSTATTPPAGTTTTPAAAPAAQPGASATGTATREGTAALPATVLPPTGAAAPTTAPVFPVVVARSTVNGVDKHFYAIPDSAELSGIAASVAVGRETWRTDMMEAARTTLTRANGRAATATLWPIKPANGLHALVVMLDGNNIVGMEVKKDKSGVWYPVAMTSARIPHGYTAGDFMSRSTGLAAQLLKTRVNW